MVTVNLYFRYQGIETLIRTIDLQVPYRLIVGTRGVVDESLLLTKLPNGFLPFGSEEIMLKVNSKTKNDLKRFKNWRDKSDYYFVELIQ